MKVNKNENRVKIDVDETLINNKAQYEFGALKLNYYGATQYALPITRHINLLKSYKIRGYEVEVWSANGWQWAEEVIKALKLEEFVDEVGTKPSKYVDDKSIDTWAHRVFID